MLAYQHVGFSVDAGVRIEGVWWKNPKCLPAQTLPHRAEARALVSCSPGAAAACAGLSGGFDLEIGSDGFFDHTGEDASVTGSRQAAANWRRPQHSISNS